MLPGELLDQVQVESTCERTYTLLTFDQEVNVAIAPGASAIWGPAQLTRFGVYHQPGVFVGAGNVLTGATTACALTSVVELDYLLEADGTIVADPCPTS
jgi:hypothetical protein